MTVCSASSGYFQCTELFWFLSVSALSTESKCSNCTVVDTATASVLTGSSVHYQRIERFNRDLNTNCSHVYAPIFYELESMNVLNLYNETDIFCLHYVYIPRINRTLAIFKDAFNIHSMSSEGNRTLLQLYALDSHLLYLHNPDSVSEEITAPSAPALVHGCDSFCPLNRRDLQELSFTINPLEQDHKGKTLFQRVQQFVFNKIVYL